MNSNKGKKQFWSCPIAWLPLLLENTPQNHFDSWPTGPTVVIVLFYNKDFWNATFQLNPDASD